MKLTIKLLSLAVATALAGGMNAAIAQEQVAQEQNEDTEVIQVRGIRGSLDKAVGIKRTSSGVVDAISAEDIGKFPDTNLAESLQRITGISIDRNNNEGSQVTVRGFGPSFNLVTLNGRQMPTSNALGNDSAGGRTNSRSFSFEEISADSVSGVEVFKTGKAHVSSGGIGATIDIKTSRPLDLEDNTLMFKVQGNIDTSNEKGDDITPEVSGLYSKVFETDMGNVGLLVNASFSERHSRKEFVAINGWIGDRNNEWQPGIDDSNIDRSKNPEGYYWSPQDFSINTSDHERERTNAQFVLQYAPNDDWVATLDYTLSRYDEQIERTNIAWWYDFWKVEGFTDANGTVVKATTANHRINHYGFYNDLETENDSIGLNLTWQATDELKFELDYHDSTSESQPDGTVAENLAILSGKEFDDDLTLDMTNGVPIATILDRNGDSFTTEGLMGDLGIARGYQVKNDIEQIQLHGSWELYMGPLVALNFGVSNTDFQYDSSRRLQFSFLSELDFSELDIDWVKVNGVPGLNTAAEFDPKHLLELGEEQGLIAPEFPADLDRVEEETTAMYVSADFEFEVAGYDVNVNAGLRYEDTDVTGSSESNLPYAYQYVTISELLPLYYENGATLESIKASYDEYLPNLDINVNLTDDLIARFAVSRTMTRSDLPALSPATNLTMYRPGGPYTAGQGNPGLEPYTSDNIDLSLEWYYTDASYVSIGYFDKSVENFIGTDTEQRIINGADGTPLTDPSINPRPGCPDGENPQCQSQAGDPVMNWDVTTPMNMEDASVDGWEMALQHVFGETGFGTIINATFVDGDVEYDVFSVEQTVALTGLSDSANFVGFYEKDGIQVRVAYNWRDDFLLKTDQPARGDEPVFTEAYGQWDMNASYDINDNFTVYLDAINITGEDARSHGRFKNQLIDSQEYKTRYAIGVRGKF
ncbi:TonB-dependent receptor [Neiella marina]|nr:TonB-dependent receptor [Neiella marina]